MSVDVDSVAVEALALAQTWCRIRSVRGEGDGIRRQADALVVWLREILGAEIVALAGEAAPLIHARLDVGAADTVVLYNMYDVMPADGAGWTVPPFEGGIVDLPGIGPSFVARGAENNKGPLAGMLALLAAMKRTGTLPVNVEILLDGEEESGSGTLRRHLADPACRLRRAQSALFPSFCEYGGGPVRCYLGFSGIAKGVIAVRGGAWGGPRRAIHSSNAPWIANPARRLVAALSLLGDEPTGALGSIVLDAEARAIVAELARGFDPAAELRFRASETFALAGDTKALLTHVLTTATATVASLTTDPVAGDGIIPAAAGAGFDLRAPPGLDPATLLDAYRGRLAEAGLAGVEVDLADAYPGYRVSADAAGAKALAAAYEGAPERPQVWPWAIGAAPAYAFAPHVESFLIGGLGRGGNAHGVDEFFALATLPRFLASIARWLQANAT